MGGGGRPGGITTSRREPDAFKTLEKSLHEMSQLVPAAPVPAQGSGMTAARQGAFLGSALSRRVAAQQQQQQRAESSSSPALGEGNQDFPPLLDIYSRTRAAPVAGSRSMVPVVDRIGSNYTPAGKALFLDRNSGRIKWRKQNAIKSKVKKAVKPLLVFKGMVSNAEQKRASASETSGDADDGMVDYVISPRGSRATAAAKAAARQAGGGGGGGDDEEERKEAPSSGNEVPGSTDGARPTTPRRAAMEAVSRRHTMHRKSQVSMLNKEQLQNLQAQKDMQKRL